MSLTLLCLGSEKILSLCAQYRGFRAKEMGAGFLLSPIIAEISWTGWLTSYLISKMGARTSIGPAKVMLEAPGTRLTLSTRPWSGGAVLG